jgi:queuine tRNA-ribosyltransferase
LSGSRFYLAVNINRSKFARDFSPINAGSKLPELRNLSKAYLHHLFRCGEPLGPRLASLNNLEFYLDLTQAIRQSIRKNLL